MSAGLEMMSVFSPTRLEAIEAVAEDALGAVDLYGKLASLVDKSLLKSEDSNGSRRFSMLLTVKEFAAERLADEPDRESRVRRAHARYFRDRTMSLREG
jgi:predicted ATPase